jgi:hypothetical protein
LSFLFVRSSSKSNPGPQKAIANLQKRLEHSEEKNNTTEISINYYKKE